MTKTLISIDLDWLNDKQTPIRSIRGLLQHIPKNIPSIMTVEHHQFLPQLRRWIKSGEVKTPFNILSIDEHHDYYENLCCRQALTRPFPKLNCGNWGYYLPTNWYSRFTWVCNKREQSANWNDAQQWLTSKNIKFSRRKRHHLSQLRSKIVAAIFCISPDFLNAKMLSHITDIVEIVANHFNMKKVPTRKDNAVPSYRVTGWRICFRRK